MTAAKPENERAADSKKLRVVIFDPTDRLAHPYGHLAHISSRFAIIMRTVGTAKLRQMEVRDARSRQDFVILADALGVEHKRPWALSIPPVKDGAGLPIPLTGTLLFIGQDKETGKFTDYPLSFVEHKTMLYHDAVRVRKTKAKEENRK